ncbi:hypothetical protein [Paracidovorax wautersii]|uniref:Uncharacterized protein n=1 Tax=Paracidovorax wautersii TaxID=1177982 RepID=A0A1I2E6K7_9BURK|nr:hypothetical protein [Paracidovorax wautersii]SFE88475.1 hypothetical protein SAMN04489711_106261 [Paracidovorax wautersii]
MNEELREELNELHRHIAWLAANTSAVNTIVRALAEANADNKVFAAMLEKQFRQRDASLTASPVRDSQIAEYKNAVMELIPAALRDQLRDPHG